MAPITAPIRGPASALYGANAYLGVINIITRSPKAIDGGRAIMTGALDRRKLGGHQRRRARVSGARARFRAWRAHHLGRQPERASGQTRHAGAGNEDFERNSPGMNSYKSTTAPSASPSMVPCNWTGRI